MARNDSSADSLTSHEPAPFDPEQFLRNVRGLTAGSPLDEASPHAELARRAYELACGPRGIPARWLLCALESQGVSRESAKRTAAQLLADETIAANWSRWTEVVNRDELRLRLEILARSEHWHEPLAPFVTFFFRASVADLYQPAAAALGRHLHRSPKLREYLEGFSRLRNIPLDRPVELNGQRTARRVMIALAAASHSPSDLHLAISPWPLQSDAADERIALPKNPADLATLLLAIEVRLRDARDDSLLWRRTNDVIDRVSRLGGPIVTRAVVQRFGGLLARCGGEQTADAWWRMFAQLQQELRTLDAGSFGRRVAGFIRLDDAIRTVSFLSEAWPVRIIERIAAMANIVERRYFLARLKIWARREHATRPHWLDAVDTHLPGVGEGFERRPARPTVATIIAAVEQIAAAQNASDHFFAQRSRTPDVALLDWLLEEMATPAAWRSHEEAERAIMAMLLLDLCAHVELAPEPLAAMLQRRGLTTVDRAGPQTDNESGGDLATTSILLRLLTWEQPGAEELVDVRMLHRVDDLRVLLALIPTRRRSGLLPVLADALEHQLRWQLRREEQFSPEAFIAQIQVRRPHRALGQSLLALCEGRTYRDPDGNEIDILPLIQLLVEESHSDDGALQSAPVLPETDICRARTRLRERLATAATTGDDLRQHVEDLLAAIGDATPSHTPRRGTVLGLLVLLNERGGPMLREGYPAWSDESVDAMLRDLETDLARMKALAHILLPEDWRGSDDVREAVTSLRSLLDRRLPQLMQHIPASEAALLGDVHRRLDEDLARRGMMVEQVMDRWPEESLRHGGLDIETSREAIDAIAALDHAPFRRHLLTILWRSLRTWAKTGSANDAEAWANERRLLDAALDHELLNEHQEGSSAAKWSAEERRLAAEAALAAWRDLALIAMDRNEELRVLELATDAKYQNLRRREGAADMLMPVRKWLHDRYLLGAAARVNNDRRAIEKRPARGVVSELGPFLGSYSTVWLALLIGSILMLDFGDAWSAMAEPEVGDLRGISITFLVGIGGAFGYIFWNLRQKSRACPSESATRLRLLHLGRASGFAAACLIYTLLMTGGLWWLLSRTDEVVHGAWAIGHIVVWAGFAMFVGVFFGLIAGDA